MKHRVHHEDPELEVMPGLMLRNFNVIKMEACAAALPSPSRRIVTDKEVVGFWGCMIVPRRTVLEEKLLLFLLICQL